jgi:hypothetical protein
MLIGDLALVSAALFTGAAFTFAIVGFVLGAAAWWLSGTLAFILGAVLMLANWPWTLFGIMRLRQGFLLDGGENGYRDLHDIIRRTRRRERNSRTRHK